MFAAFSDTVRLMGPVGGGQLTRLFNNALTITKMKNAEDVLALAEQIGLDLPTLIETIGASSGGSAALHALGTDITPDLAEQLHPLMRQDMQHFAQAARECGGHPDEVLGAVRPARPVWSKPPAWSPGRRPDLSPEVRTSTTEPSLTDTPEVEFTDAMATTIELFAERKPRGDRGSIVVFETEKDINAVLPALRTLLDEPGRSETGGA